MLHIPMRKPADVIVEDGLHPNPGPRPLALPEAKRRRGSEAGEEEQPQIHEIDEGSTPGYSTQGSQIDGKKVISRGSQREEGQGGNIKTQKPFKCSETPFTNMKMKAENHTPPQRQCYS